MPEPASPAAAVEIRPVPLAEVLPVRRRLLRPHQRLEEIVFDGDGGPDALHVGAFVEGRIVGCASVLRDPPPGSDDRTAWRIRGMATDADVRNRGIGGRLLRRCLAHARGHGANVVWCNARVGATRFYERHGFRAEGDVFDVPIVGPHVRMRRAV